MYVLIIILLASRVYGGSAVTTQEFESRQSCLVAAQEVERARMRLERSTATWIVRCVRK